MVRNTIDAIDAQSYSSFPAFCILSNKKLAEMGLKKNLLGFWILQVIAVVILVC